MRGTNLLAGAGLALALIAPGSLRAAVVETAPNGFAITETVHVKAAPDKVYQALLHPAAWWNSEHTFSGSAANLALDAHAGGCLCESLPNGGSVLHLTVVFAQPGSTLRFRGPMGPFQSQGVDGALTFTLKAEPGGTLLTLDNTIGGYVKGGFGKWPAAADAMLTDLVTRLARYAETTQEKTP